MKAKAKKTAKRPARLKDLPARAGRAGRVKGGALAKSPSPSGPIPIPYPN